MKSKVLIFAALVILLVASSLIVEAKPLIASRTFYCSLDSEAAVVKEGGTVQGGQFKPGVKNNGWTGDKNNFVYFPTEGNIDSLGEGAISLWLTGYDATVFPDVVFVFWSEYGVAYNIDGNALYRNGDNLNFRVYDPDSNNHEISVPLCANWKPDDIFNIVGTWRVNAGASSELHLYVNGKEVSDGIVGDEGLKRDMMDAYFYIGGEAPGFGPWPCQPIIDEFMIFDHMLTLDEVNKVFENDLLVEPKEMLTITWSNIKSMKL